MFLLEHWRAKDGDKDRRQGGARHQEGVPEYEKKDEEKKVAKFRKK